MPSKNAREMRKAPTCEEARVWKWLRDRRFGGYKFRRQRPIGTYIADFYCVELRLVIELDGRQHETNWMAPYDDERTAALERLGIEVLRIPNSLFNQDVELVAESIKWAIEQRRQTLTRPSATLSRSAGEGR
jgi:very-short-patch-repair endonuclease